MASHTQQTMLGVRIPVGLRQSLAKYCLGHGVKMSYFVAEAIQEKLTETSPEQAWFWSKKWQRGEKEADRNIHGGHTKKFGNVADLRKHFEK